MASGAVVLHSIPAASYPAVLASLTSYLPHSITVLGYLAQRTSREWDHNNHLWSTAPLSVLEKPSPPLFALFLLDVADQQARFFCSAELKPEDATSEEAALVADAARQASAKAAEVLRAAHGAQALDDGVSLGSVNEKWKPCLVPLGTWRTDNTKFLRAPTLQRLVNPLNLGSVALQSSYGLPPGATLERLREGDIGLVLSLTHYRTFEYLIERSAKSVCVRMPDESQGEGATIPIAWALVHADGSLGTLHVQPEYRRHGLAKSTMRALVDSVADSGDEHAGGTFGWFNVDVQRGNEKAERFFAGLEGWEAGWQSGWIQMAI